MPLCWLPAAASCLLSLLHPGPWATGYFSAGQPEGSFQGKSDQTVPLDNLPAVPPPPRPVVLLQACEALHVLPPSPRQASAALPRPSAPVTTLFLKHTGCAPTRGSGTRCFSCLRPSFPTLAILTLLYFVPHYLFLSNILFVIYLAVMSIVYPPLLEGKLQLCSQMPRT